jgi:hypothetical protein
MRFYVIYSFDLTKNVSVKEYQPPFLKKWDLTEGDEQYEFSYLGDSFKKGKHRKYVGELNKEEFTEFVNKTGLTYEDVETMGSITDRGWLPAFSFHGDSMHYQSNVGVIQTTAYVTPFPQPVRDFHAKYYEGDEDRELTGPEMEEWQHKEDRYWSLLKRAFRTEFE